MLVLSHPVAVPADVHDVAVVQQAVDERWWPVKQVIRLALGSDPPTGFHTDDARRILDALGFELRSVHGYWEATSVRHVARFVGRFFAWLFVRFLLLLVHLERGMRK